MSDTQFCQNCGAEIEKDKRFCGECGFDTKTPEHFDPTIPEQDEANPPVNRLTTEKNNPSNQDVLPFTGNRPSPRIYIIVIAVLGSALLIGGILFSWFLANNNSKVDPGFSGSQSVAAATTTTQTPAATTTTTQTPATTTTQTPAATASAAEKDHFKNNIYGTWARQDASGSVQYYTFAKTTEGDWLTITSGEAKDFIPFYVDVVSGSNGMIGTVLGGKNPIAIDCNPLGDDAIYIDGIVSTYSP